MGIQFDWLQDEPDAEPPETGSGRNESRRGAPIGAFWMLFAAAVILGVLGVWYAGQRRSEASAERLRAQVTTVLELEREAVRSGDGALFTSLQLEDPEWLSTQLQSDQLAVTARQRAVSRAGQLGDEVWANVTWKDGGDVRQRLAFFRWQDGALRHAPTSFNYWLEFNNVNRSNHSWGTLLVPEGDEQWVAEIASVVSREVEEHCSATCRQTLLPFTVRLTKDYRQNPLSSDIQVPSPRLLAIDDASQPTELFWQPLQDAVRQRLLPAHIVFGLAENDSSFAEAQHEQFARTFMAANPGVTVEIVLFQDQSESPIERLERVDAAFMRPDVALITAGAVRDLTPFAENDASFNSGDFYEQIWRGAWWRDRMWFVPVYAQMDVLFYELAAFRQAGLDWLPVDLTWSDLENAIDRLAATYGKPVFADSFDSSLLYAYAFNWRISCPTGPCLPPLTTASISAALEWFRQVAVESGQMVDLSMYDEDEQGGVMTTLTSGHRNINMWVDRLASFEFQLLIEPIGVAPFPGQPAPFTGIGSGEVPKTGIGPLHVSGYVMSQDASNPFWTWQWLKFLSYQAPSAHFRHIPARPSVAQQSFSWNRLPSPIEMVMRPAFPLARPVLLGEEEIFSHAQLRRVVAGESPAEVAQTPPEQRWFGR